MKETWKFQIYPEEPKHINLQIKYPKLTDIELSEFSGCFIKIISVIIGLTVCGFVISKIGESHLDKTWVGWGLFLGTILLIYIVYTLITDYIKEKQLKKAKELAETQQKTAHIEAKNREIQRVENEAKALTKSVYDIYQSSEKLISESKKHLEQTSQFLELATQEYKESAYSPFWDAIENATNSLARFQENTKKLSHNSEQYYEKLKSKNHTFPAFHTAQIQSLTNIPNILNEFNRVVRLGQTDFEFANIWEHRRTRDVLIKEFRSLGEAVNNLSGAVGDSIYQLRKSISSDLAKLVEEEIKTREILNKNKDKEDEILHSKTS